MKVLFTCAFAAALFAAAPVDFSGTWNLDTYLSDNAEQVAAAIRADLRLPNEDVAVGTFGRGGGFGGRGRREAAPTRENNRNTISAEDQKRIDELTMPIRYPAPTLTITQNGDAVTFAAALGQTETISHWEGPQIVSSVDMGGGRRMTLTYSIVPTTKQLMIRVAIERAPNQPGPFEIKLVYDRADARS